MQERREQAMRAEDEVIKAGWDAAHTHTKMGQDQHFRTKAVNSKRAQELLLRGGLGVRMQA